MSDPLRRIPLAEIAADALARDRTRLDPGALDELRTSIATTGLRQPVEVFPLDPPREGRRYGLIAGFRRLHCFRSLAGEDAESPFAAIPAFVRSPASTADALAAMVAENDLREALSPWEKAAIATRAARAGAFPGIAEAVRALYPAASRQKRARLTAIAALVEEMDGLPAEPERLSERDLLRYAAAVSAGFGDLIERAAAEAPTETHEAQWPLILSVIRESETFPEEHPKAHPRARIRRTRDFRRPRLTLRRERTRTGFVLHVTGRDATTALVNEIFDEVERLLGEG